MPVSRSTYTTRDALGRTQVPAGGHRRTEHHARRRLRGFCSRYGDRRAHLQPLLDRFRRRPAQLGPWPGCRNLRGQLGARVSHADEGGAPAACLAAPPARRRRALPCPPPLAGLGRRRCGAAVLSGRSIVDPGRRHRAGARRRQPARLGSDGAWVPLLRERGVGVAPLQSATAGSTFHGANTCAAGFPARRSSRSR